MSTNDELMRTWFSPKVLRRAQTDLVIEDRDGVYYVHTAEDREYRVQITLTEDDMIVTCTCTNGKKLGDWPKCHHAAAVISWLLDEGRLRR